MHTFSYHILNITLIRSRITVTPLSHQLQTICTGLNLTALSTGGKSMGKYPLLHYVHSCEPAITCTTTL